MRLSPITPLFLALLMACEGTADDTDADTEVDTEVDTDTDTDTSVPVQDADLDGVVDADDNCPNDANTDQLDTDSDADGDVCDPCPNDPLNDGDNDGVCGDVDGCPEVDDDQTDSDSDGIGDACDVCDFDADNDIDDDEICADLDVCPTVADPGQLDADSDGFGDACACDDGTYRDYTDGSCAICPSPGLTQDVIDFDSVETRFDATTGTLRFALADNVQITGVSATITGVSFDEYGESPQGEDETISGSVSERLVLVDLNDLQTLDVFADGFVGVTLTLTDACGNVQELTNLTIEGESDGTDITVDPLRYSVCGEIDLASSVGSSVASGTTVGQGRDQSPSGAVNTLSPDVSFTWTAATADQMVFDTNNSTLSTALYILDDTCEGAPILSDAADFDGDLVSVSLTPTIGQTYIVVVAGVGTDTGEFQLNINPADARRAPRELIR